MALVPRPPDKDGRDLASIDDGEEHLRRQEGPKVEDDPRAIPPARKRLAADNGHQFRLAESALRTTWMMRSSGTAMGYTETGNRLSYKCTSFPSPHSVLSLFNSAVTTHHKVLQVKHRPPIRPFLRVAVMQGSEKLRSFGPGTRMQMPTALIPLAAIFLCKRLRTCAARLCASFPAMIEPRSIWTRIKHTSPSSISSASSQ
mmetsp:Transcript_29286/g.60017  ORF Transcript_29286/g.60017 Transcript_29286/m.60017 type:complete len:201 (+) Transcript_29286:3894-4496(+)